MSPTGTDGPTAPAASAEGLPRERVIEGAYRCVERFGLAKTTVADVVKASGVSRATIYRCFPGGKEELLHAVVAWEMDRFFTGLAVVVESRPDLATMVEAALVHARRAITGHAVLQKILDTEPERLLPLLTTETDRPLRYITAYLRPLLDREEDAGRLRPGLDKERAADYVARMALSLIGSPGRWDLDDPLLVGELVREELLAGILVTDATGGTPAIGR